MHLTTALLSPLDLHHFLHLGDKGKKSHKGPKILVFEESFNRK
jgi:hypothetical protein